MREYWRRAMLLVVTGVAVAGPAAAQVPAGGEFQVNTYTTGIQAGGALGFARDGSFTVVWQSMQAVPPILLTGRRYAADGSALTGELPVASFATGELGDIVVDPVGNFAVAWQAGPGPTSEQTHVRRFDPAGAPLGSEAVLGAPLSRFPDIGMAPSGELVAVWETFLPGPTGRDVFARRLTASGAPIGVDFQVNTYTTSNQRGAQVAVDGAGSFVVVWRSYIQDGNLNGIFGQRFDPSGTAIGAEFGVNSYTTGQQSLADIAAAPDGRFVVVWDGPGAGDSGYGVFGQRYAASGAALGGEFRLNTYTTGSQRVAHVATDEAGDFVVAWTSYGQDGSSDGVFAQRFDAAGARRGTEFRVNTFTTGRQTVAGLASDRQGNFVVSWSSYNQDGNGYGVFAQRFGGLLPSALTVDTAGNHVFEPGETVDVRPSWRNVNGTAQTFAGVTASFSGPAPAVYATLDGAGDYGTVANGAAAQCADCYVAAVPTTVRPVLHWDAVFEERITPDTLGQDKLWRIHLGASFTDVPAASVFYRFVETLLHHAVTTGCGGTLYCPADATAREQMAAFVLVGKEGGGYQPPACGTPMFADVPASSPFCRFIEELARRGVVAGCGNGNFCPSAPVTREQMPVFVLRTLDPAINPPACGTPLFNDVPASSPFCRWIEELARRGVVTGCGNGSYCPADPVTREQMAVFIAVTFGLVLYGP